MSPQTLSPLPYSFCHTDQPWFPVGGDKESTGSQVCWDHFGGWDCGRPAQDSKRWKNKLYLWMGWKDQDFVAVFIPQSQALGI